MLLTLILPQDYEFIGVNGLYNDNQSERKEAFARLEKLRKKGTVTNYDAERLLIGMKNMGNRILIDTNILLDDLLTREPFYTDARNIVSACVDGDVKGCIAAHSILNMFFILRKDYDVKKRRDILSDLCSIFDVEGIDKDKC